MSKLRALFDRLRGVLDEAEAEAGDEERATSLSQVAEQFWGHLADTQRYDAYPLDIYVDRGEVYMLVTERGKLYRVPMASEEGELRVGDWQEVETVHQPVGRMIVSRQADGAYRWLNISASATLNRDGEIDSRALFDDFIRRAEETGEYPTRDFYHLGDLAVIGQSDFLVRDDALLITSGTFHDTPLAQAVRRAIEAEPGEWGDSISYRPAGEPELVEVARGVEVPVYRAGNLNYISTLPERRAASLFTTATVREVTRMNKGAEEALRRLAEHGLDEDTIEGMIALADGTNRSIHDEDMINREADAEVEAEEEPVVEVEAKPEDDEEPEAEPAPELVLDDEALDAIVERVLGAPAVTGLGDRAEAVERKLDDLAKALREIRDLHVQRAADTDKRLVKLERDEDDKRREWQVDLPARARNTTRVSYRPREAKAADADGTPDYASVAAQTLARVPAPAGR